MNKKKYPGFRTDLDFHVYRVHPNSEIVEFDPDLIRKPSALLTEANKKPYLGLSIDPASHVPILSVVDSGGKHDE